MITTDKCYENREWVHSYREEDPMGGYDPYSSSKGAAEIAIGAYRRSYFSKPDSPVLLASARAGNVIGGGDWALDRIVPDCIRALERGEAIPVRNKVATRPWQHVLEPLGGYLTLAAALAHFSSQPSTLNSQLVALSGAFNFGPNLTSNRTVADLVREVLRHWPGEWVDKSDPHAVHEAKLLNLATDKAFHFLGWQPVWNFEETLAETVGWYRDARQCVTPADFQTLTCRQIAEYTAAAAGKNLPWAG
jgi:CDP-glucose 4,6-dehydratase